MTKLVALHHQVYLTIRNQLLSGTYISADGSPKALPSEVDLARQFGVSRVTLRRSLDRLEAEDLIVRRHGAGTFPVQLSPATRSEGDLTDFYKEITTRAYGYGKSILAYGRFPTPPDILAESPDFGRSCVHIAVVSERDGCPVHVNRQYVAERFAHLFAKERGDVVSLLLELKHKGVISSSVDLTITAAEADLDVSSLLQVSVGAPLLATRRTSRLEDGTAFEYLDALTRPDHFSYRLHYGAGHDEPMLHEAPPVAPRRGADQPLNPSPERKPGRRRT